jgi:hypothetical protein
MKKIFAVAVAVSLASTAMAGGVAFEFGANFFKPNLAGAQAQNGQNFTMSWNLDSDVSLGVYTEQSFLFDGGVVWAAGSTLTVSAIQVTKGVMKNVEIGLNLGSGTDSTSNTAPLVDILGSVNILSGSGDKVSGALVGMAAARFCNTTNNTDGVNVGLAVEVEF